MSAERFVPGGGMMNETLNAERFVPGDAMVNEQGGPAPTIYATLGEFDPALNIRSWF